MEKIEYGGVTLGVLVTQQFNQSIVCDEVGNFLYKRYEIEAFCNFHPALISYELQDPPPANPIAMAGKLPGETDLAILNRLLTPRQLLKVTAGGSVVLETPSLFGNGRASCDARNGPTCEFVNAPKMVGTKHWLVHVRFVAHTNDCKDTDKLVLSNTWTSTFDVDEFYYPTRIVAGKAILRTDMMRDQHVTADSFRGNFFFPISVNYVRENVNVKLSEDGATLYWSFVDVGRCFNVAPDSPIRKCDVFRTTYSKAGTGSLARRQFSEASTLALISSQDILGTVTQAPASIFQFSKKNLPQHFLNVRCDIWGDRNSLNSVITKLSLGICLNQGIASSVPFMITSSEVICRQELTNRFVSSEITYRWCDEFSVASPLLDIPAVVLPTAAQGPNARGGVTILNSLFLEYPTIFARTIPDNVRTEVLFQRDGENPTPPGQVRSNLIEKMVVQALLAPCQEVPRPVNLIQDS